MIFTAIGTAIAGALFAGSTLAATLIGGALAFGTSLAFSYLKRPKKRTYTAVQGETQYGGDIDVQALYGPGKTKGQRTYYAKWGQGNKYNAEVFVLANGWCDGLFDYCFVYGERRALIQVGNIGGEAAHYRVDGFSDKISIRFYDGRPGQPVDAKLVADTAALGNTWKSTSVNAGQCYVIVERLYDSALFEKGKPDFEFVMRGLREYDPRKDSTVAGGSGPQRINDPSTWVFTRNPAVHRLNYQLGLRALNSGRTLIGEGKSLGQLDLATYFVAMNVCDTIKAGKPTYECGLWVTGADDHTEILKEFEDAMAGYGLNRRGLSGVIAGAPQIPVLEITKDDLDTGRSSEYQFKKSAFERYNHISGQFLSIVDLWNPQSLKPVYSNADVAADGRNRQTSNDFLQVTDPDIAQYLLTIRYRQNRMGGTATLPVSLRVGLKVQEGEWIVWNGRTWMISEWLCDESFNITLRLSETSADIYDDGGIDPGPVVIPPTPPINPSILTTVQNFAVETGMIEGAEGFQTPVLRFTWDPPQDPSIVEVIFEYRISGQTTVYTDVCKDPEAGVYQTSKDVISGVFYNARATIRTVPDRFKTWTAPVTSANVTGNQTVFAEVDLSNIEDALGWLRNSTRTAQDAIDGLIAGMMELATVAYKDTRNLARELSVELGAARAEYREDIQLAVNETMAVAGKVETLTAALGGNTASINIAWAAVAAPSGYAARYGITAAVNDEQYRAASFLMDVPANPALPSRIIMKAGQVVMVSDDDATIKRPFVFQSGVLYLDEVRVNQLSALSAVLGNVDISSAYIGTLTVGTSNIEPGAITAAAADTLAGSGSVDITLVHGPGSPRVKVEALGKVFTGTSTDSAYVQFVLRNVTDSADIDTFLVYSKTTPAAGAAKITGTTTYIFNPPSGRTQTVFRLTATPFGATPTGSTIVAEASKR
ncbi:phage tail protein [Agrobacterium tumefaciens]|uniref:phage tail protein n=1 Tax=Agrobacterium tumefaciens TaxID=358 RepID=UPI0021CEE35B|nr:phage tail protein [Agrobacterium tumefaciens]UXS24182.1 phage tail protein [Agrobacterium tumefaciens]UXS52348.1 phage tail protein [Agrobacterium tumefaciens]UXS62594.1 phage tail protein [Agrobacterium tumefaciens]